MEAQLNPSAKTPAIYAISAASLRLKNFPMNGQGGLGKSGPNAQTSSQSASSPIKSEFGGSIQGRKRAKLAAGAEGSPESGEGWDERDESRIGVKRACNECRQQKLRCDVVQEPFQICSRCRRCNLECRIDSNFKRVGKRKKNAEMEREIIELRNRLASQQSSPSVAQARQSFSISHSPISPPIPQMQSSLDQYMGSQEAITTLLDLRSGLDGTSFMRSPSGQANRSLEGVVLPMDRVKHLFQLYFIYYHPYYPLLDPDKSPDEYYEKWPLLFWTIIAVAARHDPHDPGLIVKIAGPVSRLLWATLADVPQSYHVVKALCVFCTWPLPFSSTSKDPTFMLCGLMMQIAMQIGLHRPSHAQDFSKFQIELREEELKDRVKTWAACNVVAQRVSTGYGQPSTTFYDWTLSKASKREPAFKLPDEVDIRLRIEMFSDKVTRLLYNNRTDPVGLTDPTHKSSTNEVLAKDYDDLKSQLNSEFPSVNTLYLRAVALHHRLFVFFDSPDTDSYREDLNALWIATCEYLESCFSISTGSVPAIAYATNYILQIIIAAAFTLLKLLNSFFAKFINLDYGKTLFTKTIFTIRQISVTPNDLPSRLAEVLAQLWRYGGSGSRVSTPGEGEGESSLQLKVRCRMSMSLVYDSVWRWREEFQAKGRGNLDTAVKNPTNPESHPESSASSVMNDAPPPSTSAPHAQPHSSSHLAPHRPQTPAMSSHLGVGGGNGGATSGGSVGPGSGTGSVAARALTPLYEGSDMNYEVWDPLNWMLDGLMEWPSSFTSGGLDGMGGTG